MHNKNHDSTAFGTSFGANTAWHRFTRYAAAALMPMLYFFGSAPSTAAWVAGPAAGSGQSTKAVRDLQAFKLILPVLPLVVACTVPPVRLQK